MMVDACALVSLLTSEATAAAYDEALAAAKDPWTSPLAAFEAVLVLARPDKLDCSYGEVADLLAEFMAAAGIALRSGGDPSSILSYAIAAAAAHGVGRRKLSTMDCLHYAYARAAGEPLLTLDELLRETDVDTKP